MSLFRFQPELVCSIEAGAWNITLLIPYEQHSQQEKGGGEHEYAEKKLGAILWKIFPKEPEGMCQSVLSPVTGNLRFKKSLFKQIIVTIRKKFLDNDCSWC